MMLRITALTTASLLVSTLSATADTRPTKSVAIDFRGAPPFKRVVRVADQEQVAALANTTSIRTSPTRLSNSGQFRGHPPFSRAAKTITPQTTSDSVAQFARFEEVEPVREPRRRIGPPGKRFPRR